MTRMTIVTLRQNISAIKTKRIRAIMMARVIAITITMNLIEATMDNDTNNHGRNEKDSSSNNPKTSNSRNSV